MGSTDTDKPRVKLDRLMAVHYRHPNLTSTEAFLVDFGLLVTKREEDRTYYRGFGPEAYSYIAEKSADGRRHFVGAIWAVQTADDLQVAARIPGASPVKPSTTPSGGEEVVLSDPVGMTVTLVHGARTRSPAEVENEAPSELILNTGRKKARLGARTIETGPTKLAKCGHYGIRVDESKFEETVEWYTSTFTLQMSSCLLDPKGGRPAMSFLRIEKGKEFVDHHSVFIARAMKPLPHASAHHSSFESENFESQQMGHDWLQKRGWTSCYGIGRHKYGSHIFDYWFDASGNIIEHYTDGDMVNCDISPTYETARPDSVKVWGPSIPLAYRTGRVEDAVPPQVQFLSEDHLGKEAANPSPVLPTTVGG